MEENMEKKIFNNFVTNIQLAITKVLFKNEIITPEEYNFVFKNLENKVEYYDDSNLINHELEIVIKK